MDRYTRHLAPVSQPLPERRHQMAPNQAGGWTFPVDDVTLLRRFLILGTEKGSYYADAGRMTRDAATCIDRLLEQGQGEMVVGHIVDVSDRGLAPKNDPAIFALALVLKTAPDVASRRKAALATPLVCRTASHLAGLVRAIEALGKQSGREPRKGSGGGWGPLTRLAIQTWIGDKGVVDLAFQAVKYRSRQGVRLGDVLRLAHPQALPGQGVVFDWILGRQATERSPRRRDPRFRIRPEIITGFEAIQATTSAKVAIQLIGKHRLPWEAVPDRFAHDLEVQAKLLERMPPGAMLRQLGRLTNLGLLAPYSEAAGFVAAALSDGPILHRARVHPGAIYLALRQYRLGHGGEGKLTWRPVPEIEAALEAGFFAAFRERPRSRKRLVVGVDCSGSMWYPQSTLSSGIPAAEAASVMAYLQAYGNPNAVVLGFDTGVREVTFGAREQTLSDVESASRSWGLGGGTNCALPMLWALQHGHAADGFAIYTDSQTWVGPHPVEVLSRYRAAYQPGAKMIDVAFVANVDSTVPPDFSDAGMLQVVGLDSSSPGIIDNFLEEA